MTPKRKFSVEELLEDAELSLKRAEEENDEQKISFYTAARDFILDYFQIEHNVKIMQDEEDSIEWNTNLQTEEDYKDALYDTIVELKKENV